MVRTIRFVIYGVLLASAGAYVAYDRLIGGDGARVLKRVSAGGDGGEVVLLSDRYRLDEYFQSMEGPASNHAAIHLDPDLPDSDVVYVTGVRSEVVDADGAEPVSPEFFCHANLTFANDRITPVEHNAGFDPPTHMDWRLFTLIPGKLDIQLPPGFGIPVRAGTPLDYYTMTLNQNRGTAAGDVRIKTHVSWAKGSEAMRPVFRRAVYVYQQHEEDAARPVAEPGEHAGEKCAQACERDQKGTIPSTFAASESIHPGATCCVRNASAGGVMPQFGSNNTIHWMVPPGRHIYRTDVSNQFELPFETTAHYVTGHLHPYAKSLKLLDLDSGEVLFEIVSEDFDDRIGVARMSDFMSKRGVAIRKGGRYELVAEYHNTTDRPIDAMAILYLYLAEQPGGDLLAER